MKKVIMLGLLVATVAFSGTAFAEHGGTAKEIELQKLFQWSVQATQQAGSPGQMAGTGAQPTSVPPVLEYRGSDNK